MSLANPLAEEIINTIEAMFRTPRMFASSPASFEEQFFSLFTLVAPYTDWGFNDVEAAEKIKSFVDHITGNRVSTLSGVIQETDVLAGLLETWYRNGFKNPKVHKAN